MLPQHPQMTSAYPYFLAARVHFVNALWAWISENNMTPHILVDATMEGVVVPAHVVQNGQVVLNIATRSTSHLMIRDDSISFGARFNGAHFNVSVPMAAVMAVYARETGVGMGFPKEEHAFPLEGVAEPKPVAAVEDTGSALKPVADAVDAGEVPHTPTPRRRGHLTVVK